MIAAVATRRDEQRALDRRIRKVLTYLDAETTSEMVAEYRSTAVEQYGTVEAALAADEADIKAEAGE